MNEGSQALVALFTVAMTSLAGVITALGVRNKKWQEANTKYVEQLERRVKTCEDKWEHWEQERKDYETRQLKSEEEKEEKDRYINRLLRRLDDKEGIK